MSFLGLMHGDQQNMMFSLLSLEPENLILSEYHKMRHDGLFLLSSLLGMILLDCVPHEKIQCHHYIVKNGKIIPS